MAEDTLQVMTRGGVDKKYFPTQLHASSGNSSNELTRSFFSQLDNDTVSDLYNMYKVDFDMFGYTIDEALG